MADIFILVFGCFSEAVQSFTTVNFHSVSKKISHYSTVHNLFLEDGG